MNENKQTLRERIDSSPDGTIIRLTPEDRKEVQHAYDEQFKNRNELPNYRRIELPDCCITCVHYTPMQHGEYDPQCLKFFVYVDQDGLCSEFQG